MNWRLLLATTSICLGGSLHPGIQATILNPTQAVFQDFINSTHHSHYGTYMTDGSYRVLWSVILNIVWAGNVIGTFLAAKLAERLGRVKAFCVSSGFILAGLLCFILSKVVNSYELLPIGRLFVGIGGGMTMPLQMMYFNEISPSEMRGFIGAVSAMFLEFGYILGGVLALPVVLGTEKLWLFMFVGEAAPILILFFTLPFLHESPVYLISRQQLDAAKASLEYFGHKNADASLKEIQTELECEKDEIKWRELWEKAHLRRAIFLCMTVIGVNIFAGIFAVDFFSTDTLIEVGLSMENAQYASIGIFSGTVLASVVGGFLVEKIGRRRLLLSTTFPLIIINTAIMVFLIIYQKYQVTWAGVSSIVACCGLTIAAGFGPSILMWIIPSELVPQNARPKVYTLVMQVFNISGGIIGFIFYPLEGVLGPYAFFLFILPLIGFFICSLLKFPETKCKTPMEVMKDLGLNEEDTTF